MAVRPIDCEVAKKRLQAWIDESEAQGLKEAARNFRDCIRLLDTSPTLTPPNEALTIEELREMDGEPVWVSYSDDGVLHGFWALVGAHRCGLVGLTHSRGWSNYKIAVRDWDAKFYRRPPEGEKT